MNPLDALDSLLAGYLSPKHRRLVHALLALALLVVAALTAANGDWKAAAVSLLGTLYAALNKANTPALVTDDYEDDGLSYEESGGQPFPEEPDTPVLS